MGSVCKWLRRSERRNNFAFLVAGDDTLLSVVSPGLLVGVPSVVHIVMMGPSAALSKSMYPF